MPPTAYTLGADLITPVDKGAISSMSHSLAQWLVDPLYPPSAPLPCGSMPIPEQFIPHHNLYTGMPHLCQHRDTGENTTWYPWPNKVVCVLDILRNLPRSLFSNSQIEIIAWAMFNLGISNLPSTSGLKETVNTLQECYAWLTRSLKHEFSNPRVGPHLCAYPEDSGKLLEEAWQGDRWRHDLNSSLTTPMIQMGAQDFYLFEPTKLDDGRVILPTHWFFRTEVDGGRTTKLFFAEACRLEAVILEGSPSGYVAHEYDRFIVDARHLMFAFPTLVDMFHMDNLPDPCVMLGLIKLSGLGMHPWTYTKDPAQGNDWCIKGKGHRVLKWNKHNSFLWTPAGLPCYLAQKQYNMHFLSTSNIAPLLEMMDGVVTQLEDAQQEGIWAWDVAAQEYSKFACHIGLRGKFFCHACWVKGKDADDELAAPMMISSMANDAGENALNEIHCDSLGNSSADGDSQDGNSTSGLSTKSAANADSPELAAPAIVQSVGSTLSTLEGQAGAILDHPLTKKKGRALKTLQQLCDRARHSLRPMVMRDKEDTQWKLRSIFDTSRRVGSMSQAAKMQMAFGVKDTYQEVYTDKIHVVARKVTGSMAVRQKAIDDLVKSFPPVVSSPVWRIKNLDPHLDTPVEILHKALLATCLESLDMSGLGCSRFVGQTLVQYAGSLTGRDFRVITQVTPFVLYNLADSDCYEAWLALFHLIPLVWQPSIKNKTAHLDELECRIEHFLLCTVKWTPCWFDKLKFHIVRHLVYHICRFGLAILFATKLFESFNTVIRAQSIHSNRHAPSKNIAVGFAYGNWVRHIMSGGVFQLCLIVRSSRQTIREGDLELVCQGPLPNGSRTWRMAGPDALALMRASDVRLNFMAKQLGLLDDAELGIPGMFSATMNVCTHCVDLMMPLGIVQHDATPLQRWGALQTSVQAPHSVQNPQLHLFLTCASVNLIDGQRADAGTWVLSTHKLGGGPELARVSRIKEIIQVCGTEAQLEGRVNGVLVQWYTNVGTSAIYKLPILKAAGWELLSIEALLYAVNMQHDCASHKCDTSA
ncbi:hypothetical protein HETIRDRAFT_174525 [Heterobasidion irregulare TC 32-1]|uniref:Uncharacterized protein n=1 Tax=Heterobasidion irregulare (strain TC 32-1) TaxID=747525 RepID=W4JSL1_HETIT|nr:uncharacterized protein HETIRDRAFT_174525 [Heterobasidion irregulare TC 32-1]ETW76444.1 hypothetical protein HETIRDRAFT_174525 [Heterobasidion irregulare TC 32-1]